MFPVSFLFTIELNCNKRDGHFLIYDTFPNHVLQAKDFYLHINNHTCKHQNACSVMSVFKFVILPSAFACLLKHEINVV